MRHYYATASCKWSSFIIAFDSKLKRDNFVNSSYIFGLKNPEPLTWREVRAEMVVSKKHSGIGCYLGSKDAARDKIRKIGAQFSTNYFIGLRQIYLYPEMAPTDGMVRIL